MRRAPQPFSGDADFGGCFSLAVRTPSSAKMLRRGPRSATYARPACEEVNSREIEMTPFARMCDAIVLTLVILVLLLTPFAFGGVNQTKALLERTFLSSILFYPVYFARLGIALAVMLWLVKLVVTKEVRFVRTPLDIPVALLVAYTFLWFVFSKSKGVTGGELANVVSYVALFYVVVNTVKTRLQMSVLVGVLIGSGFVMAAVGLIQSSGYFLPSSGLKLDYALNLVRPEQYWGRVGGTFVCPNHFAGYLEMIIPFALSYVLFSKVNAGRKILIAFCGLVMIVGLLLSISRGGWVAFGLSAVFLFAMIARQKKVSPAAWIAPLVVILIVVGLVVAKSEHVRKRLSQSFDTEDASYLKRLHVGLDTMGLIRDHLLVGTGPGTFRMAYRAYRRPSVLLDIRYTHNDYLHALSDYGAIGFAMILAAIIAFGRKTWKLTNRLKRRNDRALAYGVLGAVIAILVHSIIDFNMHIPSNAMTMAAILGLGMCLRNYRLALDDEWVALSERKAKVFPVVLQVGLIAVVLAATASVLFLNFRAYASSLVMHRATEKDPSREFPGQDPKEKSLAGADNLYRKSASLFPSNAKPWAAIGNMHLSRADQALEKGRGNRFRFLLLDAREAKKSYETAAVAMEEAIRLNPLDSRYYLSLARAYAGIVYINHQYKQGAPSQYSAALERYSRMAEDQFQKALELDPNNASYRDERAFFYDSLGRYDDAEQDLRDALQIVPRGRKFWEERKHLHERLGEFYRKREKYPEAEKEILSALDLIPEEGFSREKRRLRDLLDEISRRQQETSATVPAL